MYTGFATEELINIVLQLIQFTIKLPITIVIVVAVGLFVVVVEEPGTYLHRLLNMFN